MGARISPLVTSQQDFRQSIADLMGYFDGWIRRNGSVIEVGVWKHGNVPPGPTLLDDDMLGEPELEPQGFGPTFNEITVAYKDREHHFNDYTQVYRDPNNFRIVGGPRPELFRVPGSLTRIWPSTLRGDRRSDGTAFHQGRPACETRVAGHQPCAAWDGVHLQQRFLRTHARVGISFLLRLLEVEYAADKDAAATLTVEWERSKWPSLYIPPAFQGPGGFVIGPRAIWQSRITEVPYLLLDQKFDTQVVVLATRGNVEVQGYRIWFTLDPDPNPVYQLVPDDSSTSVSLPSGG